MVLKSFLSSFIISLLLFMMIVQLLDIFSNLWRYINNDVTFLSILQVALYYTPKCIFYAIPVATLFAVSFTLGSMFARNELIAVFGSGISIYKLTFPLILCGLIISILTFVFHESVVTTTYHRKNELTARLLRTERQFNNDNITVMNSTREIIYHADFYNDFTQTLTGLMLLDRSENRRIPLRIDCKQAIWDNELSKWILIDCRKFFFDQDQEKYVLETFQRIENPRYNLSPSTFRRVINNIEEMNVNEAREWINNLRMAGLSYRVQLIEYYKRFSFPLTSLIVAIIASSIGGSFRKNILIMSFLTSLILAAGYYILQMVLSLFARLGYIPPLAGAWGAFIVFFFLSIVLLRYAKT
ncbi:MAG: LptF/LptG family permease [Spirochaetes bacterium]|nr:LptF/LptG family permease [Spirochaetota bacterium]